MNRKAQAHEVRQDGSGAGLCLDGRRVGWRRDFARESESVSIEVWVLIQFLSYSFGFN